MILYIIGIICFITVITGCKTDNTVYPTDKLAKIKINDLPENYPPETAINNGDHVTIAGDANYNDEVADDFYDKVTKKEEAYIRTAHYSIAHYLADPEKGIVVDCYYDKQYFYITKDYTRDMISNEENRIIWTEQYQNLIKYYNSDFRVIYYIATDLAEITDEIFKTGGYGAILTWQFIHSDE